MFKFVMVVISSTRPWEVSNNMESTEVCHEGSSSWTHCIYGLQVCNLWLPSQTKNIPLERGLRLGSPKIVSSNLWFFECSWAFQLTSWPSTSSSYPFHSNGDTYNTLSPFRYPKWNACSIFRTSIFRVGWTMGIETIL